MPNKLSPYDPTTGPSRTLHTRLKVEDADALDGVLTETGETSSSLLRRLALVHLDAMDAQRVAFDRQHAVDNRACLFPPTPGY